jgi:hypothetical protein
MQPFIQIVLYDMLLGSTRCMSNGPCRLLPNLRLTKYVSVLSIKLFQVLRVPFFFFIEPLNTRSSGHVQIPILRSCFGGFRSCHGRRTFSGRRSDFPYNNTPGKPKDKKACMKLAFTLGHMGLPCVFNASVYRNLSSYNLRISKISQELLGKVQQLLQVRLIIHRGYLLTML